MNLRVVQNMEGGDGGMYIACDDVSQTSLTGGGAFLCRPQHDGLFIVAESLAREPLLGGILLGHVQIVTA